MGFIFENLVDFLLGHSYLNLFFLFSGFFIPSVITRKISLGFKLLFLNLASLILGYLIGSKILTAIEKNQDHSLTPILIIYLVIFLTAVFLMTKTKRLKRSPIINDSVIFLIFLTTYMLIFLGFILLLGTCNPERAERSCASGDISILLLAGLAAWLVNVIITNLFYLLRHFLRRE